jgi:DNA polymerase-3 subunit delta'
MFDDLIGNQRVKQTLRKILEAGRVPGSMLFVGEEGVGKRLFAVELAKALNCRTPNGVDACGICAICRRISRVSFPSPDDRDGNSNIIWSEYPDVGFVRPSGRNIRIPTMREVEREANFRPYEGRARVIIIEEADRLNPAASNALLKTLEEPAATTHLVLVTARPASLLTTIRSRCQVIRFAPLTTDEISTHLMQASGMRPTDADLSARIAQGSIGRATSFDLPRYKEQRAAMLELLKALGGTGDRAKLLRGAEELYDAKLKDEYEPRLDLLATLIHDVWLLVTDANHRTIINEDLRPELQDVARTVTTRRTAEWLRRIEKHRRGFEVNINRKVATDALLLSMVETA